MLNDDSKKKLEDLINHAESNGETPDFIQNELIPQFKAKYDAPEQTQPTPQAAPEPAIGDMTRTIAPLQSAAAEIKNPIGRFAASIPAAAVDIATAPFRAVDEGVNEASKLVNTGLSKIPGLGGLAGKSWRGGLEQIKEAIPGDNIVSQNLRTGVDIAGSPSSYMGMGVAKKLAVGAGDELANLTKAAQLEGAASYSKGLENTAALERLGSKLDKTIETGINKGLKPTVVGKKTLPRYEQFFDNANEAVKTIAANKDKINILDENGEKVLHPRTASEMAQAVDQAKNVIYKQYHDLAVQAGDNGAQFNAQPVIDELTKFASADNKKLPPQTRKYAEELIAEISELHGQTPDVIEERIKDLNSSLAGFYEGRTNKAIARIDASVAQKMREELDNNILNSAGEGYQELKNKYGALKSIEKEVNHRAIVNARKANKGVLDMTDVFTGGDLAAGVLTMNPALIAKGAVGRGIKEVWSAMNNPENKIRDMFKKVYSASDKGALNQYKLSSLGRPMLGASPKGLEALRLPIKEGSLGAQARDFNAAGMAADDIPSEHLTALNHDLPPNTGHTAESFDAMQSKDANFSPLGSEPKSASTVAKVDFSIYPPEAIKTWKKGGDVASSDLPEEVVKKLSNDAERINELRKISPDEYYDTYGERFAGKKVITEEDLIAEANQAAGSASKTQLRNLGTKNSNGLLGLLGNEKGSLGGGGRVDYPDLTPAQKIEKTRQEIIDLQNKVYKSNSNKVTVGDEDMGFSTRTIGDINNGKKQKQIDFLREKIKEYEDEAVYLNEQKAIAQRMESKRLMGLEKQQPKQDMVNLDFDPFELFNNASKGSGAVPTLGLSALGAGGMLTAAEVARRKREGKK